MNRRCLSLVLLAACGLLLVEPACENENVNHHRPKMSRDMVLRADHPSVAVGMELGSQLRLILPPPRAGYVWDIVSNNVRVLEQTSRLRQTAADRAEGPVVTFYALKPGRSLIGFVLVRPADQDAIPAERLEVIVRVRDAE